MTNHLCSANKLATFDVPNDRDWVAVFDTIYMVTELNRNVFYENDIFLLRPYNHDETCSCGAEKENSEIAKVWISKYPNDYGHLDIENCTDTECVCGFSQEVLTQIRECTEECMQNLPNFMYKPIGLTITWHKRPLMFARSNFLIRIEDLAHIVYYCQRSFLGTDTLICARKETKCLWRVRR